MYKCECGKEFNNAQAFNGHKSNCKIHLEAKGIKYDDWLKMKRFSQKLSMKSIAENTNNKKALILKQWISEKHVCEHCGKVMTEKYGSGRFCCRACANARKHSAETKQKIIDSLQKYKRKDKFCNICGKKLSRNNISGLCKSCYNRNYPIETKLKQSEKMKNRPRWNIHRNQTSFAEKFWETVLINNNISFKKEVAVKYDSIHCYFLDFEIIKNNIKIDLEIDGSQHKYRVDRDVIRDEFLCKTYLIYRISWNDIKSESGKAKMKEKINKFIDWYNSL